MKFGRNIQVPVGSVSGKHITQIKHHHRWQECLHPEIVWRIVWWMSQSCKWDVRCRDRDSTEMLESRDQDEARTLEWRDRDVQKMSRDHLETETFDTKTRTLKWVDHAWVILFTAKSLVNWTRWFETDSGTCWHASYTMVWLLLVRCRRQMSNLSCREWTFVWRGHTQPQCCHLVNDIEMFSVCCDVMWQMSYSEEESLSRADVRQVCVCQLMATVFMILSVCLSSKN